MAGPGGRGEARKRAKACLRGSEKKVEGRVGPGITDSITPLPACRKAGIFSYFVMLNSFQHPWPDPSHAVVLWAKFDHGPRIKSGVTKRGRA